MLPRYPIYIPSKGRWKSALTAKFLLRDEVPFSLVVEPQEVHNYTEVVPSHYILTLPFSNLGLGSIPARNWIWEHAKQQGAERHWVLDDNIREIRRAYKGYRIPCSAGIALRVVEDFVDRYENIAIGGLNYLMFGVDHPPFYLNGHVYSAMLINTNLPQRWRGRYNEDTDLCLQVLSAGWCTILVNVFLAHKMPSMIMGGGNTDELYRGDGRLKMARSLERAWPHVVEVDRRYGRPQHVVRDAWKKFDTPLRRKLGVNFEALPPVDEYGLQLKAVQPVKSTRLARLLDKT